MTHLRASSATWWLADMSLIYTLTLRQLAGKWRLIIIVVLAILPIVMAWVSTIADPRPDHSEIDDVLINGMFASAILPIIVLALATAALGNEVEDKTLGFLVLNPLARWRIVLPKLLAAVTIGGLVVVVSGVIAALLAFEGDATAAVAVALALLAGVAAYSSLFLWLGLMTSRGLAVGLLYVFLWEGLFSNFVSGIRVISIREYIISITNVVDDSRFASPDQDPVASTTAIVGLIVVFTVFLLLSVRRLQCMDVP